MKKKVLCMLLTVIMIFAVMSVTAFAADGDVAAIGDQGYATLQAAINAVANGETITLLADCDESVTIKQVKNVSFTIDGNDKTYTGVMTIDGNKRSTGTETLTIRDVNFVLSGEWQAAIAAKKSTFVHNLTVDGCSFTGKEAGYKASYGIVLRHAYRVVVKNTEGAGLYDLVYGNTAVTGFAAENITVTDSTNGIWLSYVNSTADFNNVDMTVDEVGLGFYNNANKGVVTVENANINAESAVYLGQKNTSNAVQVVVNELEGESNLMVEVDSADDKYDVILNDVNLEVNDEGNVVVKAPVYISNVGELVAFRDEVNGGNDFAGVTVYLTADIDLEGYTEFNVNYQGNNVEAPTFRPIGEGTPFRGTFDGQNYTISNMYQSGWDLNYEWGKYGSLGLFAEIEDATIKNLTIEGFDAQVEGGDVSAIAGSATGTCVFENITISDTKLGTYNNGCGSIIAWSGAGNYTFKDITIEDDVVLAGLWGSFDSSIGGVVGQAEPGATYNFKNVDIACRIDAYNDCTASYDYYNYRMCGMIMGRLQKTTTIDGRNYPDMSQYNINCENVTVTYGEWYAYHYCDPTPGHNNGRGMRVEPGYTYDGLPADYDHSTCTTHHGQVIPFDQLFGGDQYGVDGLPTCDGVTVNYPSEKNHGLQAMVDAAADSDTIVLTEDLCETCGAVVSKNINVDGAGDQVISVDTDKAFTIVDNGSISIIGGTYSNKPDNYIAEGYEVYDLQNDTWVVMPEGTTVTVTFQSEDKVVENQVVPYAGNAVSVQVSRDGYRFLGWYLGNEQFDFDTIVTSDITLTACWQRVYQAMGEPAPYRIYVQTDGVESDRVRAWMGEIVTLTVEEGVVLVVLDEYGNELELTWGDGFCTFQMPGCAVTVEGSFASPFIDVAEDDYYDDAVLWALREGITNGITADTFCPDMICTRAQMVTFLWRAAGKPQAETTDMPFTDVAEGAYYYDAVLWAVEEGITNGTSATTFSPDAKVTRAQTVTFLWRMQGKAEADGEMIFTDVKQDAYYAEAVLWAVENGITNGTSATTFSPDAGCTRAQIVTFLWRCLK